MTSRLPLAVAMLWIAAAHADVPGIPLGSTVRFNTVCAKCHEGECSGRLSFDPGMATESHIRRHAGEVSADAARDLRALLAYMKHSCAYYPMAVTPPQDGNWSAAALARLRSPAGDAHFVPLGVLAAGRYRATLRFDAATESCAQVISAAFDIAEHPGLRAPDGNADFIFEADRTGAYYLRLQSGRPAFLEGLEIERLR